MKFKILKQSILVTLLVFGVCSCQDNYEPVVKNLKPTETSTRIARHQFKSVDDMLEKMNELKQRGRRLKGRDNIIRPVDTVAGIDIPIVDIDGEYLNDGIIRYEYTNISSERLIKDGDMTYYEACGYDSLVPDTTFARVLNVKGEVQVADTVYKISRHGTYYFKANLESYFTENYSKYEQTEGTKIGDYRYLMDSVGIYRYDTFAKGRDEYAQSKDMPDDIEDSKETHSLLQKKSFASEIDWSKYPVYNADAKTFFGKVWQFFCKGSKARYYNIAQKRRTRAKFYHYNYCIKMSIGAEVELQKKNWIGWSNTKADKLTLNWHHIIIQYKYPSGMHKLPNATFCSTKHNVDNIPSIKKGGLLVSVFGIKTDDKELSAYATKTTAELKSFLQNKTNLNIPYGDAYILYTQDKIYLIIIDGYEDYVDCGKKHKDFEDNWGMNLSFDLMHTSPEWKDFCIALRDRLINAPKLIGGQIRAGACLDGKWGAMSIVKQ